MKEVWKPIKGYEGLYDISNFGRVKSHYKNKILKPVVENSGYNQVTLVKDKRKKKVYIHRLVGKHFIENNCGYREINHIDGNKSNNYVFNLEWCNRSLNMIHSYQILHNTNKKKYDKIILYG